MGLQSLVEVVHAHAGINYGHDDEDEGDDGEKGQRLLGWEIFLVSSRLVHADQLEQEIGHGREIK